MLQAGFVGPWGEWHNFLNGLDSHTAVHRIAYSLLDELPESRCIQVRTPSYKWRILGSEAPLNAKQAFTTKPIARLGHHNDCFLANRTDVGTYQEDLLEEQKSYLAQETCFVPMGGETCRRSAFTNPENARHDFRRFHWSYLNSGFHPAVLAQWKERGFLPEVTNSLGYRLQLISSNCPSEVLPDRSWQFLMKLKNVGWAAPINPREVILVLQHLESGAEFHARLRVDP